MHAIAKWSIEHRVTVNLIMVFLVAAGLLTVSRMRREMFPQFALDMIAISVEYPGASPAEVEEGICIKIEEQIKGVEGISRTLSSAREGRGSVTIELDAEADSRAVLDEVKTEIDRIDTFPEETEQPVILEIKRQDPTIYVAVFGDAPEALLRRTAEKIRDDLVDTGPISLAELVGVRDYEISIEVSEENLRRYGLSFDGVVAAVRSGSVDLPGGSVKTAGGEVLLRSKGQLYTGREFETLPLITLADGTVIRLGQVAAVVDGFEDSDIQARFEGKPAALVRVNRTDTEDVIRISRAVHEYVEAHRGRMPPGIRLATWGDLAPMVQDRIDLLLRNGVQGIVLVFLFLALFLNLRLAFWVSAGIPVAFMAAFLVLDAAGATVNMISLFAFIMTLGILVDDAIIIGENIFTHSGRGTSPSEAVIAGMGEVGWPVLMAVSTTIVAFLPLMFITGIMGKFIAVMPQAVIIILAVSLFEALVILPAHLHHALRHNPGDRLGRILSLHQRLRGRVDAWLDAFIRSVYTPAIAYVVRNRYFTFSLGLGVLIVSLGVVYGGYVPFVFFPKGESDWVMIDVTFPLGTPAGITASAIDGMEENAFDLNEHFRDRLEKGGKLVTHSFALVGMIPRRDWKPGETGSHAGTLMIELISSENRPQLSVNEVIAEWRARIGEIAGVDQMAFATLEGGPAGNPIEIQLMGSDFLPLEAAAAELKSEIAAHRGTFNIADDFKPGKPERRFRIREGAPPLGVTMADIARQLRQGFYGEEAVRIQRGKNDVKVMVRYDEKSRRTLAGIEQMRVRTADGREVPIAEVADMAHGRAYSVINRVDRKRAITVYSDLDEDQANASRIVADIRSNFLPGLMGRYPGLSYDLEGQEKRTRESLQSLQRGFVLALMGIYLLLATQFRSYAQPVIIMMAIPFGLIGAIAGHLVMGLQITMISLFGIVALSGIVVNDSLILIDFINRAVREGTPLADAVIASGRARLRPVLLTSVTTVAGLLPLLLERSFQAQFLIPMAVSISFGLIAATLLTLLYVPALYLILTDITALFSREKLPSGST